MARRGGLSSQESGWVDELIADICKEENVTTADSQYHMVGWTAFLQCYRNSNGFLGDSFWDRAAKAIEDAVRREKENHRNLRFRELSLNRPLRDDSDETFLDFLPGKTGDCANRVAFFDFLERLPTELGQLSSGVLQGYTPSEICVRFHWSAEEYLLYHERLRQALQAYETIE